MARAHILAKARAVSISWDCSFARAIDLSCRKNASIQDDRLPGGGATGKITAYSLICDGDAGSLIGNVTIQCAIGHDGTVSASAGTPDYVDAGYVDTGYQTYTGQTAAPFSDVSYSIPVLQPGGQARPERHVGHGADLVAGAVLDAKGAVMHRHKVGGTNRAVRIGRGPAHGREVGPVIGLGLEAGVG